MPVIPAELTIYNFNINTFGLFLLFGFFLVAFVFWNEGSKDGFDEEKLFDLLLITLISTTLTSRIFGAFGFVTTSEDFFNHIWQVWRPGYSFYGAIIGFFTPLIAFSKQWKWSFYRLVDLFALGISLGLAVVALAFVTLQNKFEFLFAFAAWLFLYVGLTIVRNKKIKSGYSFSIFLVALASLGAIFLRVPEYLPFYLVLVTLSAVVFLFRWRRTSNEPPKFITRIIKRVENSIRSKKS